MPIPELNAMNLCVILEYLENRLPFLYQLDIIQVYYNCNMKVNNFFFLVNVEESEINQFLVKNIFV